jgi:PAS domain S-box-containing protein
MQAAYEPVDLSALTAELASTFRAAIEKAGMQLSVDCRPLPEPVYVDREMWEKVVLNLLSNAFKYTFEGRIAVRLEARDAQAALTVEDTGTGIPAAELPHLFERFHRVEGARGRTQEGTGIGLALVAELIRMHGGAIDVRSVPGEGSAFTVSLPFGTAHLRADRIGIERAFVPAALSAETAFSGERWMSGDEIAQPSGGAGGRVLVVDDNADMRQYVARLLADRYEVETAGNGEEALARVRSHAPDLVLSDVMMPAMDGFALLRALRTNPDTRGLPVILLSARAGEEASVEGLAAGANDYLVKPFTARELLARVGAHMEMVRVRKQAAEREARLHAESREILESITDGFLGLDQNWRFTYINAAGEELMGMRREEVLGRDHWEVFAPALGTTVERVYRRTMQERVAGEFENLYEPWNRWFAVKVYPTSGGGVSVYFRDITGRKLADEALRESEERFRTLAVTVPQLIWTTKPDGLSDYLNEQWEDYVGLPRERIYGWGWTEIIHPEDLTLTVTEWARSIETGEPLNIRNRFRHRGGEWRWQLVRGNPIRNDAGQIVKWVGTCTDIQSEVDAQEALRRSEERFRAMADSAPVMIWISDRSGQRTWFNQPWLDFTGRTIDEEPAHGWEAVAHPEDRERCLGVVEKALAATEGFRLEYRLRRHDGEWRWILDHGIPLRGGDSELTGYIGSCIDITDRKRAEDALRESEERLRDITDNIPNLAWMANPDGHIFWYNRRWLEYTGRTVDEMEGWGWQSVHAPEMLPLVMEGWNESLRTGQPFVMEFPLLGADGRFRWFLTQVRPVRNEAGQVVRWFGTNTDIDDKKKAEQALRESEELARSVIEGNPDAVAVLDASGRALLMNATAQRRRILTVGSSRPETFWLETWRTEDRKAAAEAFSQALAGRPASFEASAMRDSEARICWEVSLTPLGGSAETAGRILCIARDVTAARKAEEELRQTAKLESLGVMAGGIAHDFNNLLTGILGNASLLSDSVREEDRPLAADIVLAAERAADLTRQMLAYSGKGRFEVVRTDLSVLVRDTLRLVKMSMPKNIDISLDLEEGCILEGDPGQLQSIAMNLIMNAAEAMEGKPGRIAIRTGRQAASAEDGRGNVFLEIADTGTGMDEKTMARIFDPFFTTKFTGRGLGLAAVSGSVRGHKGLIDVKSAPGKGTTFMVSLPAAEGVRVSPNGHTENADSGSSGQVLLVDDEDIVLRIGEAVLSRHGFQVKTASNGRDAIDAFRRHRESIDLIVLDMMMPVMGGEEALKAIREIDRHVPVIVCSGYNEVEVIRRFTAERVGAFLQKPYTASGLVDKVREIIVKRVAKR